MYTHTNQFIFIIDGHDLFDLDNILIYLIWSFILNKIYLKTHVNI